MYAALVEERMVVKVGHGDWSPDGSNIEAKKDGVVQKGWKIAFSGPNFAVWEAIW